MPISGAILGLVRLALACLVLATVSFEASAQGERRGSAPGDFDFYVLALSWSPGFCAAGGGDDKGRDQCRTGSGLGFVVHGLWPQYDRGFPSECAPANRTPSRIALEAARGVFPDEGLARYEWRKHGTCSGLSPRAYFDLMRAARDKVAIPSEFTRLDNYRMVSPSDVESAFRAANPGLSPDMFSVQCDRRRLTEVRICLSQDLAFRACPDVDRRACRLSRMVMPPVRGGR